MGGTNWVEPGRLNMNVISLPQTKLLLPLIHMAQVIALEGNLTPSVIASESIAAKPQGNLPNHLLHLPTHIAIFAAVKYFI